MPQQGSPNNGKPWVVSPYPQEDYDTICTNCSIRMGAHMGTDGTCPDQFGSLPSLSKGSPYGYYCSPNVVAVSAASTKAYVPVGDDGLPNYPDCDDEICLNCGVEFGEHFNCKTDWGCPCEKGGNPDQDKPDPPGKYGYYISPLVKEESDRQAEEKLKRVGKATEVVDISLPIRDTSFDWERYNNQVPLPQNMRREPIDPYTGLPKTKPTHS